MKEKKSTPRSCQSAAHGDAGTHVGGFEDRLDVLPVPVGTRQGRFAWWCALAIFVLGTLSVVVTSRNVGMVWDEVYYIEAGQTTLSWVDACLHTHPAPLHGAELNKYWDTAEREPRGHASVTRWLVTLGLSMAPRAGSPLYAMRAPIAACFGLTLAVLFLFGRRCFGPAAGWIAVAAYFFLPRVFGHAHLAVTGTPMALTSVLTVYAFVRGLENRWWSVATGVCFGLALATAANALLLPAVVLPWALLYRRRESAENLFAMTLLAPLVMVAAWPWMWDKPLVHYGQFLQWNFGHSLGGLWYMGRVYGDNTDPAPWHYPLVMTALSVPMTTLVLTLVGLGWAVRGAWSERSAKTAGPNPATSDRRHADGPSAVGLLVLWGAAVPILVMTPSSTPKYDGVRLFLSAFPFLALLAGIGGAALVDWGARSDRPGQRVARRHLVLAAVVVAVVVEGGWALWTVGPNYLSYVNALAGGRERAMANFELAYWGDAFNRVAAQKLSERVPDGALVSVHGMNPFVASYYQKWGWIKPTIRVTDDKPADYVLLQYRRAVFTPSDWLLFRGQDPRFQPVEVFPDKGDGGGGVPLLGLYRTGQAFSAK